MEKEKIIEQLREIKKESSESKNLDAQTKGKEKTGEKRYKITYERDLCIGAVACVMASPKYWELDDEGKAILKGGKEISPGIFELDIGEEDYAEMFEAAKECPVLCIHIVDKKTGKKII